MTFVPPHKRYFLLLSQTVFVPDRVCFFPMALLRNFLRPGGILSSISNCHRWICSSPPPPFPHLLPPPDGRDGIRFSPSPPISNVLSLNPISAPSSLGLISPSRSLPFSQISSSAPPYLLLLFHAELQSTTSVHLFSSHEEFQMDTHTHRRVATHTK